MAYSGVVRIESDVYRGSAVLIDDRWLLTAAHVVEGVAPWEWDVIFERGMFDSSRQVAQIITHEGYDASSGRADLALVKLSGSAPSDTRVYSLFTDEVRPGTMVSLEGYGERKASDSYGFWTGVPLLQVSYNTVDATTADLGIFADTSGLAFDYDTGSLYGDTLGQQFGLDHTGLGRREGFIGEGDSGGGLFVSGQLAGTLTHMVEYNGTVVDGGYGEVGFAQSIAYYHDWIARHVPSIDALSWQGGGAGRDEVIDLALLYEAGLNRRPDDAGLNYWVDRLEAGTSMTAIAQGFLYSPEFGGYPEQYSDYITQLYFNVLDRVPESSGQRYWETQMAFGMSAAEVLLRFADSPENQQQAESWLPQLQQDSVGDWFI
ncbi:MAG: DUF4214 domain-containing protein [Oceanospirillales bacterium]|uniref:Uncharacterized protein DUF4214 n=1 Tax=Marinobacterium halophilum TaxID=267374 RepID=A0A2P8EXE8_9GAMM|nr:DUF4214 domain-containing protein [Marinobacterium halophilum]MBR9830306.1 DUF4214 domain-containing protein [Oceanospirillales bacterium]PSL14105.1 uncharacterized protein DUF4214 [Marinobacterium halophilum]